MTHSTYLPSYRLDGYSPRVHLSVYTGAVVASGALTATPDNNTVSIAVNYATGSESDVLPGMLILFYTSGGDFKGAGRVRFSSAATATTIPVRELAQGSVSLASGDLYEVRNYYPPDTKLVASDATFSPDGMAFATYGLYPPPRVCSGGAFAGWVDAGETTRVYTPDGSNTALVDPDSATPPTHAWSEATASVTFDDDTAESPELTIPVGQYLVEHRATDPDNSAVGFQGVPVVIHDAASPPYEVLLSDYSGDHQQGTNWTVEVLGLLGQAEDAVTCADIPELCLCILWADDVFADAGALDLGRSANSGRSHILAIGYARRVRMTMSGDDGLEHVTFEFQSPIARLSEIAGYSKVMVENASPDEWAKVKTLGFARGIWQNWWAYTTMQEAGIDGVQDASFDDARYPAHYVQRSDPVGQMRELADARNGRITEQARGAVISLQAHPAYRPLADRSVIDITYTGQDAYSFDYAVENADSIEIFELRGITAGVSGNAAVYSRSPGTAPGGGKNADAVERVSPDDQTEANAWCGLRYAYKENVFINGSGVKQRVGELTLRLPGQYLALDFIPDYVKFNFQGKRVDFNDLRFWLKRHQWALDPDSGEAVTVFTLQAETAAPAGTTYVPPADGYYLPPVTFPTLPPITYFPSTSRLPSWNGVDTLPTKVFLLDRGGAHASIATAWSPSLSSLTYTDISTGLSGIGVWACSDPYDYRRRFALTADGLYRCDNIWSFSTWTQVADNATIYGDAGRIGTFVGMSINRRGYIYITSGTNAFIYSTDYGATWNRVSVDGAALSYYTSLPTGNEAHLVAVISSHNNPGEAGEGVLYATTGTMYFGVGNTFRLRKSTDWGATWTAIADRDDFGFPSNFTNPCNLHIPYIRSDGTPNVNDSSQELYLLQDTGNACYVSHSTNAGLSGSAHSHGGGATSHTGWQMMSFTHLGSKIAFAGKAHGLSTNPGIIISDDSGATEIRHSHLFSQGDNYVCLNGFSNHSQAWILWCQVSANGGDAKIIWTVDDGANYQSVATPSTFSGTIKLPAYVEWDLSDFIAPAA